MWSGVMDTLPQWKEIALNTHIHTHTRYQNTFTDMLLSHDLISNDTIYLAGWHKYVAFIKIVQSFQFAAILHDFYKTPKSNLVNSDVEQFMKKGEETALVSLKKWICLMLIIIKINTTILTNNLCMHSITQFTKQLACLGMVNYFFVKPENTSRSVWLFL